MSAVKAPALQFFDESYRQRMDDLQLFVQVAKSQFQFAFFDPYAKKMVGVECWEIDGNQNWHQISEELTEIFRQKQFQVHFKSVYFSLVDSLYTLVPSSLYEPSKKADYLKLNHRLNDPAEHLFLNYEISVLRSQIVYAFPLILHNFLIGRFPKLNVFHSLSPCLEAFSLQKKQTEQMHLYLHSDRFDFIYFADDKLQLVNSYPYQTVEDFIYYLLFVIEQLNIDRDRTHLTLSGEFEEGSTLHDLILQYIRRPEILERSQGIEFSKPLDQLTRHQYANLFNLYLCG